jgi:hypothetical protein
MVLKVNLIAVKLVHEEVLLDLLWLYHAAPSIALYFYSHCVISPLIYSFVFSQVKVLYDWLPKFPLGQGLV